MRPAHEIGGRHHADLVNGRQGAEPALGGVSISAIDPNDPTPAATVPEEPGDSVRQVCPLHERPAVGLARVAVDPGELDAGDAHGLCRLAAAARGRGEEVFATPLPRERPEPGKRAVRPGSVVWVDLDEASAGGLREIERLRPHLWVASGAGQHLYWRLRDELAPAELEELNRRLCHRLGGDPACCEYGRIMRLPGTFNQKRGQWSAR